MSRIPVAEVLALTLKPALKKTFPALLAFALGLALGGGAYAAQPQTRNAANNQRMALVIGNDSYANVTKLANARADARAMAEALKQAGFDVTLRTDLTRNGMLDAVRTFKARLSGGSDAVFFFAGHGVQLGAANYLLPVDITAANEEQVKDDALALQRVLEDMTEQKARFSLAIVDACRDNPFPRVAGRSIGGTRGLAPTTAATGQMVIYSAGAGQQALDKLGNNDRNPNGLFTRVFLQEMQRPGVEVGQMLRNVRNQVVTMAKQVGHEQVPALYDQAVGEFVFRPGTEVATINPSLGVTIPAPAPVIDPSTNDRALWETVKDSKDANEMRAYLDQFPNGLFAGVANARLKSFQSTALVPTPATIQTPPPSPPVQVATVAPNIAATVTASPVGSLASMGAGRVFRDCAECPEMVVIPPGSFVMGSPANEERTEQPQHSVTLSRHFAAGKFEVTFEEWNRCVQEGGCTHRPKDEGWGQGRRPVINVSWEDAKTYTEWLSRKTGKSYRLLTEAEWEYVARAGTTTAYSFGNSITPQLANYDTSESFAGSPTARPLMKTVPVGGYPANAFGLHDVHGNVEEWTEDCVHGNYNGAPTDGRAWTGGDCGHRVQRGGSWGAHPRRIRSSGRNIFWSVGFRSLTVGFRLARTD